MAWNCKRHKILIIRDYIIKEIMRTFLGVFIVLFLIILSTQLLKSLSAVVNGKIPIDFLFALIGLTNIQSLTLLIPLTLFLAILLALSRLYKDSEMVALSACGIGPGTLLKCVLIVVLSFVFLEIGLVLVMAPWASSKTQISEEEFKAEAVVELITPGQFTLSSDSTRVLYAEQMPAKSHLTGVFLHVNNTDSSSVLASSDANIVTNPDNNARYIVFQHGHRYDGSPGSLAYRHVKFQDYGVLLEGKAIGKISFDRESLPSLKLLQSDIIRHKAELQWRISQVLMMIILSMLAVPLSKSAPRQGRYAKMAVAIFLYIVYSNLLLVAMNWLKKGVVEPYIGLWWVHISFFILFLILFSRQMGWLNGLKINGLRKRTHNTLYCPDEFDEIVKN